MEVVDVDVLDGVTNVSCMCAAEGVVVYTVGTTLYLWFQGCDPTAHQLPFSPATMSLHDSSLLLACNDSILVLSVSPEEGLIDRDSCIPPGETQLFELITFSCWSPNGEFAAITSRGTVFILHISTMQLYRLDSYARLRCDVTVLEFGVNHVFVCGKSNQLAVYAFPDCLSAATEAECLLADCGIVSPTNTVTALCYDSRTGSLLVGLSNGDVVVYSTSTATKGSFMRQLQTISIPKVLAADPEMMERLGSVDCLIYDLKITSAISVLASTSVGIVALSRESFVVTPVSLHETVCSSSFIGPSGGTVAALFSFEGSLRQFTIKSEAQVLASAATEESEVDLINARQPLPPALAEKLTVMLPEKDKAAKPVTFGKAIKSSGYKSTPWSVQKARTDKAKAAAKKPAGAPKPSVNVYPAECAPCASPMQKTNGVLQRPLHRSAVTALVFDSAGNHLVSGSSDCTANLLKLPVPKHSGDGISVRGAMKSPLNAIDVNLSLSTPILATGCFDGSVALWKPTKKDSAYVVKDFGKEVKAVKFFYMDQLLLIASGGTLHLTRYALDDGGGDLERKRNNSVLDLTSKVSTEAQSITALDGFNATLSSLVVWAESSKRLCVHDIATSQTVSEIPDAHQRQIHSLAMHTNTRYSTPSSNAMHTFATASTDKCVRLWDIRQPEPVRVMSQHQNSSVKVGLALSPCGRFAAVGSEDRSLCLYDIGSGELIAKNPMPETVGACAFHPFQSSIAVGANNGVVRFFGAA